MTRDGLLQQLANDFQFDPTEEIKVGGNYRPIVIDENIAYVSGQIPRVGDVVRFAGLVGDDISIEDARRAAAIAAMRALVLMLNRLRKYRPTLLNHELAQNFQRGIFHGLEYGSVNFGFRTCL
jgi:hypothetical protein